MGEFRSDRAELGPRLDQMRGLGRPQVFRQVRDISTEEAVRLALRVAGRDGLAFVQGGRVISRSEAEKSEPRRKKMGRPRKEGVREWEALGLSRSEYYRRLKAGTL